eukprot:gnl/TRDRNA2_/TRDRNA2_121871_c1_seq1.p1 gnl/TRDRNA2_/TRDRNA2_121871_c1~~gnl/TRDRNA2_/TRDRNA2_121871_c1_seq1.p1  ORF type:complete len:175 (+),score=39.80 gnl/TRDRNA2_/TRDRNA2_121871_c1_seq1:57-527(+)
MSPVVWALLTAADLLHFLSPDGGPNKWHAIPVAVAMGAVNTLVTKVAGVTTNAVTGNVQKVSMALFDNFFAGGLDAERKRESLITAFVVGSFLAGAASSFLWRELIPSFIPAVVQECVFLPIASTFAVLLWAHDFTGVEDLEKKRKQRLAVKGKKA